MTAQAAFEFAETGGLLDEAARVVARSAPAEGSDDSQVEKALFRSPAGKRNVVARLLPLIPPHKTYVEPFVGSAAVFFGKEPADVSVLNDRDSGHRLRLPLHPGAERREARQAQAVQLDNERAYFNSVKAKRTSNDFERFHRFIYLNRWATSARAVSTPRSTRPMTARPSRTSISS